MALLIPPQAPPSFDLHPASLIEDAERLVSTSAKVWDQVAQIAPEDATFTNAILPIIQEENNRFTVSPLLGFVRTVSPSKELRDASDETQNILSRARVSRFSRHDVFRVVDAVWQKNEKTVDPESRLFLEELREQFIRSGQGLSDENAKAKVGESLVKLDEMESDYKRNLNSDIGGLWLTLDELQGVPQTYLDRWKADGDRRWVDRKLPNYTAVMQNAVKAEVRQKVWFSWVNKTKDSNGPLLKEILILRDEVARTLGYKHHADLRESDRILKTHEALQFLETIRGVLQELGKRELESLKSLKAKEIQEEGSATSPLSEHFFSWDKPYYQRLKKTGEFRIDQEHVAEYFPFERCVPRMLTILGALFGVEFFKYPRESRDITTWHPEVDAYAVRNDKSQGGSFLGYFYLDAFPRDHKYSHKGHFRLQPGFTREDGSRHYPCSAFVTNYSPPSDTRPSLLKIGEVVNCFHELGHSLHNLTSKTQHARFHGTATPRDFVEIPSVMLEHIFWDRNIVRMISGHYSTQEHPDTEKKLPDELIDQLIASQFADIGLSNLTNLHFSAFDLKIHSPPDHDTICNMNLALEFNKLGKEICFISGPEDVGLGLEAAHSFSRYRFPIGYNTVYYTYLLARSFSYDIFESKFRPLLPSGKALQKVEEIIPHELRQEFSRYRKVVLQPGGNVTSYLSLLKSFLGRDPNHEAYVEMLGRLITVRHDSDLVK